MAAQMVSAGNVSDIGPMAAMAGTATGPANLPPQSDLMETRGPNLLDFPFPFPLPIPLPLLQRTHSLHAHGFVFAPTSDGAYPLTPADPAQPVGTEGPLWANVGVN